MRIAIFILINSLFILQACKKNDLSDEKISKSISEKFFAVSKPITPSVEISLKALKQLNDTNPFIEKFSEEFGFPNWDQALTKVIGDVNLVFIPVVLENKRTTNAIIKVDVSGEIKISSFAASDYEKILLSNKDRTYVATEFASLFLKFDNLLFGTEKFLILDQRLFPPKHLYQSSEPRLIKLHKVERSPQLNKETCLMLQEEISWIGRDAAACNCPGPCDYLQPGGCNICTEYHSALATYWVGDCGGGGGYETSWDPSPPFGGGSSGSSGGGSGGGWVPYPQDPQYDTFLSTLTQSQTNFWNNPSKAGYVSPLIEALVANNFSSSIEQRVRELLNFAMNSSISPTLFENYFLSQPHPDHLAEKEYNTTFWEDPNRAPFTEISLPAWSLFESAFPAERDANGVIIGVMSPGDVWLLIGGYPYQQYDNGIWYNACAARTSRGLNYSGISIPNISGVSYLGGDGKYYIVNAKEFNNFMYEKFAGTPDRLVITSLTTEQDIVNHLAGKKGIYSMVLTDTGRNAEGYSGHADILINGEVLGGASLPLNLSSVKHIDIYVLQ